MSLTEGRAALEAIAGPGVAVAFGHSRGAAARLYPAERRHIARALPRRQAEFAAGRQHAREALAGLGLPPCPLVPRANRSPEWPPGVVGSISHMPGWCAAVATTTPRFAAIGLDIEDAAPLLPELEDRICTASERRLLDDCKADTRGTVAKLIFSAKEAFYKCQYPLTADRLRFADVSLAMDLEAECFGVEWLAFPRSDGSRFRGVEGRFKRTGNIWITLACWRG